MKFVKTLIAVMFCVAVLAGFAAKANAAVIPVVNSDFSLFPTGQTAATYLNVQCADGPTCRFADNNTVGWTQSATRSSCCDAGQFQLGQTGPNHSFNSDPLINGTTPEPIVFREINATATQTISTPVVAGVTYTLDVDLGFPKGSVDYAAVYLTVDGQQVKANPLASYGLTQTQMQLDGDWYDFEASYTAPSSDPNGSIQILLWSNNNGNGFGFFGDVRLTDSLNGPVLDPPGTPEPATWAMLLIGFGGIAGVATVRQRRGAAGQLA
jgi:hypothetical protein